MVYAMRRYLKEAGSNNPFDILFDGCCGGLGMVYGCTDKMIYIGADDDSTLMYGLKYYTEYGARILERDASVLIPDMDANMYGCIRRGEIDVSEADKFILAFLAPFMGYRWGSFDKSEAWKARLSTACTTINEFKKGVANCLIYNDVLDPYMYNETIDRDDVVYYFDPPQMFTINGWKPEDWKRFYEVTGFLVSKGKDVFFTAIDTEMCPEKYVPILTTRQRKGEPNERLYAIRR